MEENKKETPKHIPQEELYESINLKAKDIASKKNILYYVGIILLNICFLALCWVIVGHKESVVSFNEILSGINWNYLLFIFVIIALIVLIEIFNDFFILYKRTKKRRFGLLYLANTKNEFYNSVTLFSGGFNVFARRLSLGGINEQAVVDIVSTKKLFQKFSLLIYSLIFIIVGAIFYITNINIWLLILGIVCLIINSLLVLCILIFDINKERMLTMVAKLCKTLYKCKLIKDYEGTFKKISNQLFVYSASLKFVNKMSIVYIILNLLKQFLRHFILFVILQSLNFASTEMLFEIVFKCTILDLVIDVLPLQKGTAIFELLYIALFNNVFFSGYLLWGLVAYRFFDYFIYILIYLITLPFDRKGKRISKIKN